MAKKKNDATLRYSVSYLIIAGNGGVVAGRLISKGTLMYLIKQLKAGQINSLNIVDIMRPTGGPGSKKNQPLKAMQMRYQYQFLKV